MSAILLLSLETSLNLTFTSVLPNLFYKIISRLESTAIVEGKMFLFSNNNFPTFSVFLSCNKIIFGQLMYDGSKAGPGIDFIKPKRQNLYFKTPKY